MLHSSLCGGGTCITPLRVSSHISVLLVGAGGSMAALVAVLYMDLKSRSAGILCVKPFQVN